MDERPRVTIAVGDNDGLYTGTERVICVGDEVSHFLYGDGPNPFGCGPDPFPNTIPRGVGVLRDTFDPAFERL